MKEPPIIFSLFGYDKLANSLRNKCHYERGIITLHQFPDEETLIKIESDVRGRTIIFIAGLERPNNKLLSLLFAAETARSLGASKVILIAPYLAYMRQDKVFESGQGITSKYFARLISGYFDGLITIDPHLHRWHTLNEIYSLSAHVLHATESIAEWILGHIKQAVLIGPDEESRQWVEAIALKAKCPYLILEKRRAGDRLVEVSIPNLGPYRDYKPILIDDIISTGMTMMSTIQHLQALQMASPIVIGVHAVFAGEAYQKLIMSGVDKIITCNTILHVSNGIDISDIIVKFLKRTSGCNLDRTP